MATDNPYQSPTADVTVPAEDAHSAKMDHDDEPWDEWITTDTVVPRSIAATIDNTVCFITAVVVAKQFEFAGPVVQFVVFSVLLLGYFFVLEGLFSRTPGKFATGLMIIDLHGRPAGWKAAGIRFLWRFLEVNPILLGTLPAAVSVILSRRHQRLGDRYAGTLVVPKRRL